MNLMIESLKKRIEDSKLNIIEAYVEFFGEEYKDRIIDRVSRCEILVYKREIEKDLLDRLQYLLIKDTSDNPKIEEYIEEIKKTRKYLYILDNYDNILSNVCKSYFPIRHKDFNVDNFLNYLRAFDKKEKMTAKEKDRLKSLFFECLDISKNSIVSDFINKENLNDFKETILRIKKLKSHIILYLQDNFDDLNEELLSKGFRKFKLIKPKKGESYCTYAFKYNKLVPVCVFNLDTISLGRESLFLHEFGHAIDISDDLSKSGLLVKNNYRYLNEALTDSIANEVANILKRKKYVIFTNKNNLSINSRYSILEPIGDALIDNFRSDLLKMKFDGEEEMYKVIDKNTMLQLEELCVKALFNESKTREERNEYVKEAVRVIENYKNTKNRY